MIELYRSIIPSNKIINDNHDTHYRIHAANINWISWQFNLIKDEVITGPGGFKIPKLQDIDGIYDKGNLDIRCEIWKSSNRIFDSQNYSKTFKPIIDLLVESGYMIDDNVKYVNSIAFSGGGPNIYANTNRAFRYDGDCLPEELTQEYFTNNNIVTNGYIPNSRIHEDRNSIMVRVIVN